MHTLVLIKRILERESESGTNSLLLPWFAAPAALGLDGGQTEIGLKINVSSCWNVVPDKGQQQ